MVRYNFRTNPAVLLLIFVYLGPIHYCLSWANAWVQPEELHIKAQLLETGTCLNRQDIGNGLNWRIFEYQPRTTRPLSSYFEIIDTKFRCWLWQYVCPYPSLSLTWIFSLLLAPFFLYRLLRNMGISVNTAVTLAAFYLVTPGVLSHAVMLFRPAKPMANFFIIFCLYLASGLKKESTVKFLIFWTVSAFSLYWDETSLLIIPAAVVIFPSIFKRKLFLGLWLFLPLMALAAYFVIIPYLSTLAGHDWPHLLQYVPAFRRPQGVYDLIKYFFPNAGNLILESMGLFHFSNTAPAAVKIAVILDALSWLIIIYYIFKAKKGVGPLLLFLVFLLFLFNLMMAVTMLVWGPYYYGSFWSLFFVLWLSGNIEKANIPKPVLLICFFFITLSSANCFLGINQIYKKYHWYPFSPSTIQGYFQGSRAFFDKDDAPVYSTETIKSAAHQYWQQVKHAQGLGTLSLPAELGWMTVELEPVKVLAETYNAKGDAAFMQGHWPQAVFDYHKAVGFYEQLKEYDKAQDDMDKLKALGAARGTTIDQ